MLENWLDQFYTKWGEEGVGVVRDRCYSLWALALVVSVFLIGRVSMSWRRQKLNDSHNELHLKCIPPLYRSQSNPVPP